MTNYRISTTRKLPEGVKLYKSGPKNVTPSSNETLPLTKLTLGASFIAYGYDTARDLRGIIHKKDRTRGMKFVSQTDENTGNVIVWRVK